jgi:hypothetical protein
MQALLDTLQAQVQKARAARDKGGIWNWAVYIFWACVIAISAAFVMYQLNKKNGQLATLRTQVEVDELHAANAQRVALLQPSRDDLKVKAAEALLLTNAVKAKRVELQEAQAETDAQVERALGTRDWASLDAANAAGRDK